jgi:hypothetical protein
VSWSGTLTSFATLSDDAFCATVAAPERYAGYQADSGAAVKGVVAELNAHLARKGALRRWHEPSLPCTGAGCSSASKLP